MASVVVICLIIGSLLHQPGYSDGYKILGIFPTMSKSHYITGGALMKGLAEAGHEVTAMSPFPLTKPIKNYRDLYVGGIVELMKGRMPNILEMNKRSMIETVAELFDMGTFITNFTLHHETVQNFLRSPTEKFDVIIMEVFLNEAMLGFGHHFKAPTIGFSTFGASKWTNDMVGTPSPPSYVPHPFLSFTDHMTFIERVLNTALAFYDEITFPSFLSTQAKIYQDVFPGTNKPDLETLRKNVSLVLLNQHVTMTYPRPYVPNMIEIGGIHINRANPRPLPSDIERFMNQSKHGVVYFSMGSNIQSTQLPLAVRDGILKAFSKLKQRVLWKWEDPNLPGKPDNVFISKWFPQDDILAHPKVKLFITHGGLLSSTEAVYHGVPIIGIPVFGDQSLNMARAVNNGYGLSIMYPNLTESSLTWALNEMLGDEKYSKQAKQMSVRYRDQPMTPMETAIYWIEYIVRHKGAPHLHAAGQDLCWWSYHNVDVYGFLLLILCSSLYLIVQLVKAICCRKGNSGAAVDRKKKRN